MRGQVMAAVDGPVVPDPADLAVLDAVLDAFLRTNRHRFDLRDLMEMPPAASCARFPFERRGMLWVARSKRVGGGGPDRE